MREKRMFWFSAKNVHPSNINSELNSSPTSCILVLQQDVSAYKNAGDHVFCFWEYLSVLKFMTGWFDTIVKTLTWQMKTYLGRHSQVRMWITAIHHESRILQKMQMYFRDGENMSEIQIIQRYFIDYTQTVWILFIFI